MPREIKNEFRELGIRRPDEVFISLPSPATVFQGLRIYQNSAVAQLAARGIIEPVILKNGVASVIKESIPSDLREQVEKKNSGDNGLTAFLTGPFSMIPLRGAESIYRRAGLPSRKMPT